MEQTRATATTAQARVDTRCSAAIDPATWPTVASPPRRPILRRASTTFATSPTRPGSPVLTSAPTSSGLTRSSLRRRPCIPLTPARRPRQVTAFRTAETALATQAAIRKGYRQSARRSASTERLTRQATRATSPMTRTDGPTIARRAAMPGPPMTMSSPAR